jgi:hypothetical protein
MTSLTLPATSGFRHSPSRSDVIWAAWRQHRAALLVMITGFGATALWLGVTGLQTRLAHDRYVSAGCLARYAAPACYAQLSQWHDSTWVVSLLPWIIAVFAGAPLVTREFETGSYRFSLTQAVSRRRQVTTTLLLFGGIVLVGSVLTAGLAIWAKNPWHLVATGSYPGVSYWSAGYFGITPVVLPATALLGFCLGAALGALIERTVPAMAATLVAVLLVTGLTTGFGVTDHGSQVYGPLAAAVLRIDPVTKSDQSNDWPGPVIFRYDDHAPAHRFQLAECYSSPPDCIDVAQQATRTYYYPPGQAGPSAAVWVDGWYAGPHGHLNASATQHLFDQLPSRPVANPHDWFVHWLAARGVSYRIGYQPASRYWLLQAVLGAILLALAALAGLGAVLGSQHGTRPAARRRRRAGVT